MSSGRCGLNAGTGNYHVNHAEASYTDLRKVPFSRSTPLFVKQNWSAMRRLQQQAQGATRVK